MAPVVYHAPPQDRRQPGSFTSVCLKKRSAFPSGTERLLKQILGLMPIAHQPVSHPVQGRAMLRHPSVEIGLRKRQGRRSSLSHCLACGWAEGAHLERPKKHSERIARFIPPANAGKPRGSP